jgi:hypothetical protein
MIDLNILLANDYLDLTDTKFPAGSILELRTGAPAGAENAAGGTLLVSIVLPATPWVAAAAGVKARQGVWSGVGLAAAGTGTNAGHFRLKNAAGTRLIEGTLTVTGGGGDATIDNVNISQNQVVNVTGFSFTL